MAEGAMEASDPDIIKALWPVAEKLEGDEGFFGHGMIGGSGSADGDVEGGGESAGLGRDGKGEGAGSGMIFSLRKKPTKGAGFGRFDASDENRLFFGMKAASDGGNL
jgi:hypothetical protein